jgi:hypothetical protein
MDTLLGETKMVKDSIYSEIQNFPAKAAVVVDGGYWRKIIKEIGVNSVDLLSLTDILCKPAFRIRTYFFDGKTQVSQSFHDGLQLLDRFEVYLGGLLRRSCPKILFLSFLSRDSSSSSSKKSRCSSCGRISPFSHHTTN